MSEQQYNVLFPREYNETNEDSTVFGDLEPFAKGGYKISIMQKTEDGDGKLAFLPEHWGTCFGINESIYEEKDESKKKEESEKKEEAPKFEVTYILDNTRLYTDNGNKMTQGAQETHDAFKEFIKRTITHLKSEDVIDELPADIQMKVKNPELEESAIRPVVQWPKKEEIKTMRNGNTKKIKIPDYTKPPRIYGMRVLKSKKGAWISTFEKRSANPENPKGTAKDEDAIMESIDPNSLMGVSAEIQPVILLDYWFVKENKLCLQLRVLEGSVIPFSFRKLGGLAAKKFGLCNEIKEGSEDTPDVSDEQKASTEESDKSERRSKQRSQRIRKENDE